ncbi:Laminin beta chain [Fasciolopsis buskii]|uniref:Laminin beta chain n=1 Tax=Fasciolopsis buskii TaxID=27845 RepID=A0A8E0VHA0_9TREM|nr:Laminin beta chain [Fasciolopsis buski]
MMFKVHTDRKEAEERTANVTKDVNALKERLSTMYSSTEAMISNAENFSTMYGNLTKELFDELAGKIQYAKLNITNTEAKKLASELDEIAKQLESRAQEILTETDSDRRESRKLLEQAEMVRDNAIDFKQQISQLKEAENIYEELTKHPILTHAEDSVILNQLTQLNESISGLEAEKGIFSRESSAQADQAREASEKALKLLANANMARKDSADTLRELENMDISFKQLEEKLTELDRLMKKIDIGDKKPDESTDEEDSTPTLVDPTKLMQEVQNYTTGLEKDTEEIKVITANLKRLETESATLQQGMKNYVIQFNQMAEHLSRHTKYHRTCK